MTGLLAVRELAVSFPDGVDALRGVSFELARGETLAVIGESGAGKSTLVRCLAGLVPASQVRGSIRLAGQELVGAPEQTLHALRGEVVAVSLQGSPLNPVIPIGSQLAESLRERRGMSVRAARHRGTELATEALLDPALLERYPHELSGGERHRAALAMALALDPELVVLDEPTGGLDPATGHDLVERIRELARARGFGLIVVTHALADAARLASRAIVLYAGVALEAGETATVIGDPAHPYTWALVGAYPVMSTTKDLRPIRGTPPDPHALPPGCPFHPRCPQSEDVCRERPVSLTAARSRLVACHFGGLKDLLDARGLGKTFRRGRHRVPALTGVSLWLREGEALGVVGRSGSGKSTLARILTGHLAPDTGQVHLQGQPLGSPRDRASRVQLVMQDPWDALSPRLTVAELVREPLDLLDRRAGPAVSDVLTEVGLPTGERFLCARSHQLSGGQLQRVALARALVAGPKLLVADEPTSLLDPSEQARLMVTLRERQSERGLGLVLVSHDLALIRKVTDRVVVLDAGRVVEAGRTEVVCAAPRSDAARRLIEAAPRFPLEPKEKPDAPNQPEDVPANQRDGRRSTVPGLLRPPAGSEWRP